jgi:hypothetical protein
MMSLCDAVAERLACGEPLAELSQHAEDCPRCQGLLMAQRTLAGGSAGSVEPAQGFTSRMTVAASQRLVTRHRRRVIGYATLSAAAAALATFALVREPTPETSASNQIAGDKANPPTTDRPVDNQAAAATRKLDDPWRSEVPDQEPVAEDVAREDQASDQFDEEVRALYVLSRSHSAPLSADWREIERPLQPYAHLLRRVSHR